MPSNEELQSLVDKAKRLGRKIEIISNVKSGKEATVYKVLLDNELVAMKVYKNSQERTFKSIGQYAIGKNYKEHSIRKAVAKGNKFARKLQYDNLVKREFFMLIKLYSLNAKIPKPIWQMENAIFMEFLGNQEDVASRLCDVNLNAAEARKIFKQIIETMLIFWKFGIVHADLSEYNILLWNNEPYIIDFPQAVDTRTHPNVREIFDKDLHNITNFFSKFIKIDVDKIKKLFP